MNDIKSIFTLVYQLMQTRLTFGSFSFSIFQVTCAFWAIAIVGTFIVNAFDSD